MGCLAALSIRNLHYGDGQITRWSEWYLSTEDGGAAKVGLALWH